VSYSPSALKRKLTENPFSFIHIINPEFGREQKSRKNSPERFTKVREKYESFRQADILFTEEDPAFYLYEQVTPTATFTGLICGVSTGDYRSGKIKKHEQTLTSRENMFCQYLDISGLNAEPVLLTYRENLAGVEAFFASKKLERPEYEFTTTDRVTHRLWVIKDQGEQQKLMEGMKRIDCLYIADGHHRMASSALLAEKRRRENPHHTGREYYNFTMAMLMPGDHLQILPFHRLLSAKCTIEDSRLLEQLRRSYDISRCIDCFRPSAKRQFGMRLKDGWYSLRLKEYSGGKNAYAHLDSVILTESILKPIIGIVDQKTDPRIQFIPDTEEIGQYERMIDAGKSKALFTMHRVEPEELYAVSDEGSTMPPKSTYIEPKLRSGMVIMPLR
jgi:uncharacterized protein (DUF1015 family)